MKIAITRSGGYDPALGPDHPSNLDPTLEHKIADPMETREVTSHTGSITEYRWRCACRQIGHWHRNVRHARACGAEHVADHQRGRNVEHEIKVEPSADARLFRWTCSCGCPPGEWKTREVQARIGGTKHASKAVAMKTVDKSNREQ